MKVYELLQIILSTSEHGLWWDHDRREYNGSGWGIMLKFKAGRCIRHGLKPKYWLKALKGEKFPSAWKAFDPKYHMIIQIPFMIVPFFSISFGKYGFYIGFKNAKIEKPEQFGKMFKASQIKKGSQVLVLSGSIRRSRWN